MNDEHLCDAVKNRIAELKDKVPNVRFTVSDLHYIKELCTARRDLSDYGEDLHDESAD